MSEHDSTPVASRRAMLAGALSGWVLAGLPEPRQGNDLVMRLRTVLTPASSARPDDRIRAREIVFGFDTPIPIERLEDTQILARVRRNIAADYRAGRLADLHGWRVAVTESHALAFMRAARPV